MSSWILWVLFLSYPTSIKEKKNKKKSQKLLKSSFFSLVICCTVLCFCFLVLLFSFHLGRLCKEPFGCFTCLVDIGRARVLILPQGTSCLSFLVVEGTVNHLFPTFSSSLCLIHIRLRLLYKHFTNYLPLFLLNKPLTTILYGKSNCNR